MNDKIKEIALRIWSIHPKDIDALGLKTRIEYYEMELEKFAELIIKECLKVAEDTIDDGDAACCTNMAYIIKSNIKKHFGVENESE